MTHKLVFSQSQLKVIEAVVLAVASDDFTLGANARRWLDDDEYPGAPPHPRGIPGGRGEHETIPFSRDPAGERVEDARSLPGRG